jgi:hypothetical protein
MGEVLARKGLFFLFFFSVGAERFQASALREASLAKEIHDAGINDMKYVYMGRWSFYRYF